MLLIGFSLVGLADQQVECKTNYWGRKVIWDGSVQCKTGEKTELRCRQIEQAYLGNTPEINMKLNLSMPELRNGWTMLMTASHEGYHQLVEILLENGASKGINMQDRCGWTALMFAAFTGLSTEVVQLLLQHGADVNLPNKNGRTALFMASEKGYVDIVKVLLLNGANVKHRDAWDIPAIVLGAYGQNNCHPSVVKAFLQLADVDRTSLNKALWIAVKHCCHSIVNDILCSRILLLELDELTKLKKLADQELSKCNCTCYKIMKASMFMYETNSLTCTGSLTNVSLHNRPPQMKRPLETMEHEGSVMVASLLVIVLLLCALKCWRRRRLPIPRPSPLYDNTEEFMKQLNNEVAPRTVQWKQIATNLDIHQAEIDHISRDQDTVQDCFREVFKRWRNQMKPPFNWKTMVDVLDAIGEHWLANTLRERHILGKHHVA